jgi:hypothetical protein
LFRYATLKKMSQSTAGFIRRPDAAPAGGNQVDFLLEKTLPFVFPGSIGISFPVVLRLSGVAETDSV